MILTASAVEHFKCLLIVDMISSLVIGTVSSLHYPISVNFVHITMMALGLYVCAKKTEHVHNTSRGHSKPERGPKRITSKEHDLKTKSKESADEVKKSTPREAKEKPKAPVKAAGDEVCSYE
ncbi:hypothetical protein Q1695_002982 [Nippostrongylus brasiliensis]|nr:hypothetical protein Q1695_002982 [Nippostrongylus brasiliensis]